MREISDRRFVAATAASLLGLLQLVVARPLTGDERTRVDAVVRHVSGGLFETAIETVPALDRTKAGKLRMFHSEVSQ